eukprot:3934895-Rhodomonas_salina.1
MFGAGVWPELQQHYAEAADAQGPSHCVSFVQHVSPVNSDASVISNGEDAQLLPDSSASIEHPSHHLAGRHLASTGNRLPSGQASGEARDVIHGDPGCNVVGHADQCRNSLIFGDGSSLAMLDGMPDSSFTSILTVKEE